MGEQSAESANALLLGAVLDGIPESAVLGITLLEGSGWGRRARRDLLQPARGALLDHRDADDGAEDRPHSDHLARGRGRVRDLAALGYGLLDGASGNLVGLIQAFAGGACDDARRHDDPGGVRARPPRGRLLHGARLRARLPAHWSEPPQDREEVLDLPGRHLDAVVLPLLALDLDEAPEGVLTEDRSTSLRLGRDLDRLAERLGELLDAALVALLGVRW